MIFKEILDKIKHNNEMVIKFIKLTVFTVENYRKTRSNLWAGILTYYSLLSIVPVIAIAFTLTKGFGVDELIKDTLIEQLEPQKDILKLVFKFSKNTITGVGTNVFTSISGVLLLWSVIRIFSVIEKSFNEIWKIKHSRKFIRKITDYFSIVFLFPVIVILINGLTSLVAQYIYRVNYKLLVILQYFPYLVTILFLTILYLIIPNVRVKFSSALLAGLVAGIAFQVLQALYIYLQRTILIYGVVYGSFSAVPLYIMWQYFSWIIVLLGAHLSFIVQNSYKYELTLNDIDLSFYSKRNLSLIIVYFFVENVENNGEPLSTLDLAEKTGISISLVQELLNDLEELGLLVEVLSEKEERLYQISRNINNLSIGYTISRLENLGYNQELTLDEDLIEISQLIKDKVDKKEYQTLLKDIKN